MKWMTIVLFSVFSLALHAEEVKEASEIKIELALVCPESEELQNLVEYITSLKDENVSYEQWVKNIMTGMDKLTMLLETGKVYQGGFTLSQESKSLSQ